MKAIMKNALRVTFIHVFITSNILLCGLSGAQELEETGKIPWERGDWWILAQKQRADWMRIENPPWIDAGRLKFMVKNIEQAEHRNELFVEVTDPDLPRKATKRWGIKLVYSDSCVLVGGEYNSGNASIPMPRAAKYSTLGAGGLNIAAICSERIREIPTLKLPYTQKHIDVLTGEERVFHRVDLKIPDAYRDKKEIQEYQLWFPGEPYWRYYERSYNLPVKIEMIDCSFWQDKRD